MWASRRKGQCPDSGHWPWSFSCLASGMPRMAPGSLVFQQPAVYLMLLLGDFQGSYDLINRSSRSATSFERGITAFSRATSSSGREVRARKSPPPRCTGTALTGTAPPGASPGPGGTAPPSTYELIHELDFLRKCLLLPILFGIFALILLAA